MNHAPQGDIHAPAILPSAIRIRRSACRAAFSSWVIITIVFPHRWSASSISQIMRPERLSRFPQGSSASISDGRAGYRPGLSRCAAAVLRSSRWDGGRRAPQDLPAPVLPGRLRGRCFRGTPRYISGSSTFSRAVRVGIRLKLWNTNPIRLPRIRLSWLSSIFGTSSPSRI